MSESSSVGRASAFQAEGREFESRLSLHFIFWICKFAMTSKSSEEIRKYNRRYYLENREHLLKKQKEKNQRLAKKRRQWIADYKKELECIRCGENHPATLTFHHKDSSEKEFEIGNALALGVSLKRILAEIEKCEVLCANCHAIEHLGYLYK